MAERRMFAKSIIDSDMFLDMSLSTQALYFHLSMRADDDGFINNPKKIQRMISATQNDMDMLLMKNFIIPFDSGVCVIKHWRIHNYIRSDRYKETLYKAEKQELIVDENKAYFKDENLGIPSENQMDTQARLGKVRLGKASLGKATTKEELEEIEEIEEIEENPVSSSLKDLGLNSLTEENIKKLELTEDEIELLKEFIKNSTYDDLDRFAYFGARNIKNGSITKESLKKKSNKAGKFNSKVTYFQTKNYDYDALENELMEWDENEEEEKND